MGRAVACVTLLIFVMSPCHASNATTYDQRQQGDVNVHLHVSDIGIIALLDESLLGGEYGQYDYSYDYTDPVDPDDEKPSNATTPLAESNSTTSTTQKPSSTTKKPSTTTGKPTTTSKPPTTSTTTTTTKPSSIGISNDDEIYPTASTTSTSKPPSSIPQHQSSANTTPCQCSSTTTTTSTTAKTCLCFVPTTTTIKTGIVSSTPLPEKEQSSSDEENKETGSTPKETTSVPTTTTSKSILAMLVPSAQTEGGKRPNHGGRRRCNPGYFRDSRGRCKRLRRPSYQAFQNFPFELPFGIRLAARPSVGGQEEVKV